MSCLSVMCTVQQLGSLPPGEGGWGWLGGAQGLPAAGSAWMEMQLYVRCCKFLPLHIARCVFIKAVSYPAAQQMHVFVHHKHTQTGHAGTVAATMEPVCICSSC